MDQTPIGLSLVALLIASLSTSACTTSISHQKLAQTDEQTKPGFSYYLPRQKYLLSITYELEKCPEDGQFEVAQTATVVEESEADLDEHYLLTYDTINSALKTSTFNATTFPNSTLKTVGVQIEDKSAAVVKSVVSTAISVAKMALGMPSAFVQVDCNQQTQQAFEKVRAAEAIIMNPEMNSQARTAAAEAIAHAKNQLRIVQEDRFVPTWDSISPRLVALAPEQREKWFDVAIPPDATFSSIEPSTGLQQKVTTGTVVVPKMARAPRPGFANAGQGVIYRDPMPAVIRVCAENCSIESARVLTELNTQIAQLGRYMVVTMHNNGFDKNNVALTFAANGLLQDMTFGKESSLEKFAGSLSDAATQVQGFDEVRRKQIEAEEAAERAAPLSAIQAETALLNARAERIEAENRLRALGGSPNN